MAGTMPTCTPGQGRAGGGGRGGGRGRGHAGTIRRTQRAADELRKWRTSVSMDKVKQLRKMYNDAGVTIYAYKSDGMQKNMQTTDAEFDYVFTSRQRSARSALHLELPAGPGRRGNDEATGPVRARSTRCTSAITRTGRAA